MGSPRRTFKNVHLHLCRYHKNLVCFHFLLMDDHFCLRFSGRHDYCIPFGWCHLQFFRMGVGILHSGRCMSDLGGSLVVLCIRYTRGARLHIARRSRLHWSSLKQSFTTHSLAFNPDFFTILGHFRGQFWQQLGLSFAFNGVANLHENHFETGYQ